MLSKMKTVVMHGMAHDIRILLKNFKKVGVWLYLDKFERICTLELAQKFQDVPKTLEELCKHFDIKNDKPHDAVHDAAATLKVYQCWNKAGQKPQVLYYGTATTFKELESREKQVQRKEQLLQQQKR